MKRQGFLLLLFFIFVPQVFAQDIVTGNASSKSTVETNIEGGGSVTTRIEVEANGEKKTLDSDKPGTYKVEVESSGSSSNTQTSIGLSPSTSPQASPTAKVVEQDEEINKKNGPIGTFVMMLIKNIFDSFKNIFRF